MTICSAEEFVRLRLSDDRAEYMRAAHDDAPVEVWNDVLDRFPDLRIWVVRNKTVPVEILRALCSDPDPLLRSSVADKRKAPLDVLASLASDVEDGVRLRLACNKKVPRSILRILADDAVNAVREVAAERLRERSRDT